MVIASPMLAQLRNVRHGFFTRQGGVSEGIYASLNGGLGSQDAADRVAENRRRMEQALDVAVGHLVTAYQIHSADVIVAERPWTRENAPRADGIVTRVPGLAVGASTADCGPVLFGDDDAGVVGAAHAGWKGALTGILEAVIGAMENLGARRSNIVAAIGPLIRQANYEVGPEFVARFSAESEGAEAFFAPSDREGHSQFDLPGFIRARLAAARIARIDDLGLCTYADPDRFFSYRRTTHRRESDYGRHISAIALTGGDLH
jgi:polyphenol oxidase